MEGFCRGCLIKYDDPMELLQYTEKNRRLFVYSTGLQVKRNDTFTFQLCKDCFLNMKQACKFKKNCRTSDKRFRNYLALKEVGDPVDFCTFLKNSDETLTFRFPMASGNSTPANQKSRDDDNESTCTSIRNFMTDILQGEEMPDTEARIIKEVIEEEADLLDDSLDSHWLQDDMSIDTDFRLDFSFSQFSTPHTVNDDRCYTPKQKEDQMSFDTINTEKQTKILKEFTNAFKTDDNIEELSIFVGGVSENTENYTKLKELNPMGIDEIDGMGKSEIDSLKSKQNLKEVIIDLGIDETEGMDTSDSKTVETDENFKDLNDFGIQDINSVHFTESNKNLKELCNFGKDEIDGNSIMRDKSKALKEIISNLESGDIANSGSVKSYPKIKEFDFGIDEIDKSQSNLDMPSPSDDLQKAKIGTPDFDIPKVVIGSIQSNNDASNSSINIEAFLNVIPQRNSIGTPDFEIPKDVGSIPSNNDVSNSSINIEAYFNDRPERDRMDTPDFDIPKRVNSSILSNNGVGNSSINIEAFFNDSPEKDRTDTPDFEIPKGTHCIQSANDASNSSINIEALLKGELVKGRTDTPDFEILKAVRSIKSMSENSNSSINIEALLKDKLEKDRIDTPDFEIPKAVRSIQSFNDNSNSSLNIEALLKEKNDKERIDTPDFDIPKAVCSIQPINDNSNSSFNIEALLKEKIDKERIDTPDFDILKAVRSIQPINDNSNSSLNIEALLKDKIEKDIIDTPDFDIPKGIHSIQSSNDISNSSTSIEALLKDKIVKDRIDTPDFEIPKGAVNSVQSKNDVSNSSINMEALLKDKPCSIDKNLEEALKNSGNKEFSLEDILISPPVIPAASAASTPTITNILFGENLDTTGTNTKIEQYHDVQGDIELFEEFFQNDTKEFYVDDIKRENEGFKPIEFNDIEVANKENDSQNIDMEICIDVTDVAGINNYDKAFKKTMKEPMIHISQDDENDKFNMKYLYCKLCDIRYDTSRAFSGHFAKKHNIKIVKPRKPNIKKNKQDVIKTETEATINIFDTPASDKFDLENSYCKLCNKKYDTIRALSVHFTKTHRIKIERPKSIKVNKNHEIVCNSCGVKSRDQSNFAKHVKKCSQKGMVFKCDRCELDFTSKGHLEKHMSCHTMMKKRKQTGKEFVCTICGAIIHKQCNFLLHMRRHRKDYSVKCEVCDKGFYRQIDLKVHMRSHTGETEFSCKFCPKLFTRRDVLLRHILIHLDERLYECDYCKKRFIKKFDLKKHIQNESCRPKKKLKAVKKAMNVDIPEEKREERHEMKNKERVERNKEESVEMEKEVIVEVIKDVTVIYAKGSDVSLKQQLPFLETERSN